ncbi:Nn.00g047080.m01.CDS01 [Neocucurbitaria sp. VM-36]
MPPPNDMPPPINLPPWRGPLPRGDSSQVLSRQPGALVTRRGNIVEKTGRRVKPREDAALRLVPQYTSVPVPTIHSSSFTEDNGFIRMSYVDGECLDRLWDDFQGDDEIKEQICRQIWDLIYQFQAIPKPPQFAEFFQCCADGTTSNDVLIRPLPTQSPDPLASDDDLRLRIYERYLDCNGRRYEKELPDMLPRSEKTVFTHADIAPRNILIGEGWDCPVVGIVDWEQSGWYPEYWEYANIMKPSVDEDWQMWMERTAPERWDISGIKAARRVLF